MLKTRGNAGLSLVACAVFLFSVSCPSPGAQSTLFSEPAVKERSRELTVPHFQKSITLPGLPSLLPTADHPTRKGRLQIGVRREFSRPEVVNGQVVSAAEWIVLPDGVRIWAAQVVAEGAKGLRLHLRDVRLPDGAKLLVYSPDPSIPQGQADSSQLGGQQDIWMPTILSERMVFECQVPPSVSLEDVSFTLDGVSHLYESPAPALAKAGGCNNDVSCEPAWKNTAAGVARISFVENGNTYVCTGSLLAGGDPANAAGYFLTANHCVNSQTVAGTLEFYWLFQTAGCHAAPPALSEVPRTAGGGDLIATSSTSDFALVRLRRGPPPGVFYLSWTPKAPGVGEAVAVIHHPGGSYKRISFGTSVGVQGGFTRVRWSSGVTEPGSSGAPLLNSHQQVIGQLYGGSSSCSNPTGIDTFGRFDLTYQSITEWLSGSSSTPSVAVVARRGLYVGLFQKSGGYSVNTSGTISLRAAANNRFTGVLRTSSLRVAFSGHFDNSGYAVVRVGRGQESGLVLEFQLDTTDLDRITGTISGPAWSSNVLLQRAVFNGTTQSASQAGSYTFAFPDAGGGDGIGRCTLSTAGVAKFMGKLPAGSAWTASGPISKDGDLAVHVAQGTQVVHGTISFGAGYWNSPTGQIILMNSAGGWTQITALGSRYVEPGMSQPVVDSQSVDIVMSGQSLNASFSLRLGSQRKTFAMQGGEKLSILFYRNGVFRGQVANTGLAPTIPLLGVILQNSNQGYGFYSAAGQSGSVRLIPR